MLTEEQMTTETDTTNIFRQAVVGLQMLFVAFGALVPVPIPTGLNPSVALFTAGVGTLIFQVVTRRQVPICPASSFAFIAPIIYGVQTWGIPATLSGLLAAGLVYMALSFLIMVRGQGIIHKVLPSVPCSAPFPPPSWAGHGPAVRHHCNHRHEYPGSGRHQPFPAP